MTSAHAAQSMQLGWEQQFSRHNICNIKIETKVINFLFLFTYSFSLSDLVAADRTLRGTPLFVNCRSYRAIAAASFRLDCKSN